MKTIWRTIGGLILGGALLLPAAQAATGYGDSPVFAVDLRVLTGGLTVNGRVLDAASQQTLTGVSISLAGQNTTTLSDGTFSLANVSLASGNTLTISKSGFVTDTETPSIPASTKSITLPDILLQTASGSLPVVTGLKPKYNGIFLSLASILNDYTASVNWNGHTPGNVEFYVNGALVQTPAATSSGATATLDMAIGFKGSLAAGANKVRVIAVGSDGARSAPFDQRVTIIPPPPIIALGEGVLAPFQFIPGNDPSLSFDVMFPDKDIPSEAFQDIPFLGEFGWNFAVGGGFEYSLNSGDWEAHIGIEPYGAWADRPGTPPHSTITEPQFFAGNSTIDFAVDGRADGTATQTGGIVVNTVGLDVSINYEQELLAFYLTDYVPGAQWARCLDFFKRVGVDVNSIQRVTVYGDIAADLSVDAQVNPLPIKYHNTDVSLTLGAKASYEPDVKVAKGEITVGGQVTGDFQINPALNLQSINGRVFGEVKFTTWHWNLLDEQFVLLNYTYMPSAMLSLATTSQGSSSNRQKQNWLWVPVASKPPHLASRDYLNAGPEIFVAGRKQQKLAPGGVSALSAFRKLGQSPAKGSAMAKSLAVGSSPTPLDGASGAALDQANLTLVQNTYPGSSPALAAWGTELMLLYVTDNGSSNILQSTDIAWMRWDGTNWSAPQSIRTNTQSEFEPSVAYDGNGDAIAVWERVADTNLTSTDLAAMAEQMEIVWSRWDRASGTWTEPVPMTSNNYLDHEPLLCGPFANGNVLAVWTKNEANLLLGTNAPGNDTVMWTEWSAVSRTWSTPQTLVDGLAYRLSQSLAGAGNHAVYAWTADLDGVLTNDTDQQLFYLERTNGVWGAVTQFTTNAVANKGVRAAVATNGTVFMVWQSGSNLVLNQSFSTNIVTARLDSQTTGFADYAMTLGPLGNLVLLWQDMTTNGSHAHYTVYDPASVTWSQDELLRNDSPLERSFAPVWDNAGNLTVAYDVVNMYITNLSLTLTDGTTVTVTNVPQSGQVDLAVTKRALINDLALLPGDFTASGNNYLAGDAVTLSANVRNLGDLGFSNVVVSFYDGDPGSGGLLITNVTLPGWLSGAATNGLATALWTVPPAATNHALYAVVNQFGAATEFNPTNNTQSVSVGGTDLAVSFVSYNAQTNGSVRVLAQVQNLGAPTATNSTLAIRLDGQTGIPLASVAIPALDPGELAQVALDLPSGTQPAGEQVYRLMADDNHVVADVNTNNNTTAFSVFLWVDSDGDGIPDSWMMQYFGHPTGLASDNSRAQDSASGDGISNLQKYLTGMNPLIWDNLHFIGCESQSDGRFNLTIFGQAGSNYTLQASTDLVNWASVLNFTCTNSPTIVVDPGAKYFGWRFYRLAQGTLPVMVKLNLNTPAAWTANGLGLNLEGPLGFSHIVQVSTDLLNWQPLTNFVLTNYPFYFSDSTATNYSRRFYRAVVP